MSKVNLVEKFDLFSEKWCPKIVGELNESFVKLAKFEGEFLWHKHDHEDEMFFVTKGVLTIKFRDKEEVINPGEFIIIKKGIEHKPVAKEEVHVMLIESKETLNTGEKKSDLTHENLEYI